MQSQYSLSREFRWLAAACLPTGVQAVADGPARGELCWRRIGRLAIQHQVVLPLAVACGSGMPPALQAELASESRFLAAVAMMHVRQLCRVLVAFEAASIDAVLVKGPALSADVYGSALARQSNDLDILVRRESVERTRSLLHSLGFTEMLPLEAHLRDALLETQHECLYRSAGTGICVDLHWDVDTTEIAIDVEELWADARPHRFMGRRVMRLSPELEFVLLCAHGSKHGWDRLKWLVDIKVLSDRPLAWEKVWQLAQEHDATAEVSTAMAVVGAIYGAAEPVPVAIQAIVKRRLARLEHPPARLTEDSPVRDVGFMLSLPKPWRSRLALVAAMATRPAEREYRSGRLPPFMYRIVRLRRVCAIAARMAMALMRRTMGLST
ncbi:nucleotidyltransferase domain-containing protein [Ramlibacter albus]|uniref:Nucleotidyltransferase family protein n=1 Tax=Ramlibacter albus TaxID=2079448 RepID=A0A923S2Z6_9BURK|nr:nucleotidyltransferase family protein [Ramlibacter albus]MBC5765308.1 nucleotidyltransferase family protein [Ramlibacter albus]